MKRGTRALLAAFLLALPISGFAADKYAVKLSDSYWQLIGVGGLFQLAGEGSAAQNPDFSSPNGCSAIAVVDIADLANHISWDGDFSTQGGNQNTIASTSGDGYNFGAGTVPAAANLLNTDETNTSGIGLPYHSVLGVRAIAGANGARKAVVVIGTGIGSNAGGSCKLVGKDYTSPMRTMYVVSPYASAPDVLITYQAIYEGEPFKISFKNSLTALWGTPSSDRIYIGTLDRAKTYANPARINSELTLLVSTAGSQAADAGALNQVICTGANAVAGSYNCAFTNDIGQYLASPFSIRNDYEINRTALDGNLTLYRYAAINTPALWEIQTFTGDGTTESTTSASNLNLLTPGYGYWARHVRGDTSVDGGLLLQENIEGRAEFYNGKLAEGWNLLAFDDSRLRYTTSGVVI
ncbi:MAG: hypothetical protein LBE89_02945, partial [Helicobacteraceae bacterium]|nr:hypothetical protein [Helicobacteraceae bacterium]